MQRRRRVRTQRRTAVVREGEQRRHAAERAHRLTHRRVARERLKRTRRVLHRADGAVAQQGDERRDAAVRHHGVAAAAAAAELPQRRRRLLCRAVVAALAALLHKVDEQAERALGDEARAQRRARRKVAQDRQSVVLAQAAAAGPARRLDDLGQAAAVGHGHLVRWAAREVAQRGGRALLRDGAVGRERVEEGRYRTRLHKAVAVGYVAGQVPECARGELERRRAGREHRHQQRDAARRADGRAVVDILLGQVEDGVGPLLAL
mmetsp:Transcript_41096/g.86035  ORF Transcript_41096/g.86035 Transcript_41096/m.86035 type:complete len:263 (+) Transcript_41096:1448-2236(+)